MVATFSLNGTDIQCDPTESRQQFPYKRGGVLWIQMEIVRDVPTGECTKH